MSLDVLSTVPIHEIHEENGNVRRQRIRGNFDDVDIDAPVTEIGTETDTLSSSASMIGLSASMIAAQQEADALADQDEEAGAGATTGTGARAAVNEDDILPAMPRLLQLPKSDIVAKTQELKSKGEQLDLLLLKAESYSKFIIENQKRSKLALAAAAAASASVASPAAVSSSTGKTLTKSLKASTSRSPACDSGTGGNGSASKRKRGTTSPTPIATAKDENSSSQQIHAQESQGASTYTQVFSQPSSLVGGTLMPYQLEGLQWLLSLWENGLSGILADEMGLGKTIQIISLIAHLRSNNTPGPFLIAGPLATLPNWMNEFKKWLPCCPVVLYHGSKAERESIRKKHMRVVMSKDMCFPVVVTSFEICMIDRFVIVCYAMLCHAILVCSLLARNKLCVLRFFITTLSLPCTNCFHIHPTLIHPTHPAQTPP